MFGRQLKSIASTRKNHPVFFCFSVFILSLYGLQMVLKTEITPLGYFSLYSNAMQEQSSYRQILPCDKKTLHPIDIYDVPGTGFLMLEILPTRYDILANSDHCNQMNHKLRRIGLGDDNCTDCNKLKDFKIWFQSYGEVQGLNLNETVLMDCGFKNGKLVDIKDINDAILFK